MGFSVDIYMATVNRDWQTMILSIISKSKVNTLIFESSLRKDEKLYLLKCLNVVDKCLN